MKQTVVKSGIHQDQKADIYISVSELGQCKLSMSSQYKNIFFVYLFTYLSYIAVTATRIVVFV